MEGSDDDEEDKEPESPLIESLKENAKYLSKYLEGSAPNFEIENSYDSRR
jgi:hypothetical protein